MASILVCDDVRSICEMFEISLRKDGHRVETVQGGEMALKKMEAARYDVVVSDIKMPRVSGLDVLRHAREVAPEAAVILITAVEDYDSAVQAVRAGAFDYIHKGPGLVDEVRVAVGRALEVLGLRRQNRAYKREAAGRTALEAIVGCSPALERLKTTIRTVAATASTVVIHGESGTGKELVARAVHGCSSRAAEPFVSINCGAFPETLLESELFGYVRGAFTGANQNKAGLFETANGGTIFLDEIGEMTPTMQVKLLRVLQERTVRPVGGTAEIAVDVRVVAATHRDLARMVGEGGFREDLYYRISVIPVDVPPLRERLEDVPFLANHFLKRYAAAAGREVQRLAPASLEAMLAYDWPGNVRELENAIERAVALETSEELHVHPAAPRHRTAREAASSALPSPDRITLPADGLDMERYIAQLERSMLQFALEQCNGVQTRAADLLKLSYRSFRHLMKKYEL